MFILYFAGPLSVSFEDCDYVSLDGRTFSWLLSLKIFGVRLLQLAPEAFMLDPTAANVGEHGPGMMVSLVTFSMPECYAKCYSKAAMRPNVRSHIHC